MKKYVISKSQIKEELNVSTKAITYWTEKYLGEVESSQGKDTMYTKEEYEKLIHVYLYRTLNCPGNIIDKFLDDNVDNNSIIDDQISKLEESIEFQKQWLSILKYSKYTGVSIIDIFNNSKGFKQKDYRNNLLLYSYLINHLELIKDESMYNIKVLYGDEEYLDSLVKEIANYAVLLIDGYSYDSNVLQTQINTLVDKSSKVFGKATILSLQFAFEQVKKTLKEQDNYDEILNNHNQAIYYYFIKNNSKTIFDLINEINELKSMNEKDYNKFLEELYEYCSTISILTKKGIVKILRLSLNLLKDNKLSEVFKELENRNQYINTLTIIYKYFNKKLKEEI